MCARTKPPPTKKGGELESYGKLDLKLQYRRLSARGHFYVALDAALDASRAAGSGSVAGRGLRGRGLRGRGLSGPGSHGRGSAARPAHSRRATRPSHARLRQVDTN